MYSMHLSRNSTTFCIKLFKLKKKKPKEWKSLWTSALAKTMLVLRRKSLADVSAHYFILSSPHPSLGARSSFLSSCSCSLKSIWTLMKIDMMCPVTDLTLTVSNGGAERQDEAWTRTKKHMKDTSHQKAQARDKRDVYDQRVFHANQLHLYNISVALS